MNQDGVLEVTSKAIRLRKRFLDPGMRARAQGRNRKERTSACCRFFWLLAFQIEIFTHVKKKKLVVALTSIAGVLGHRLVHIFLRLLPLALLDDRGGSERRRLVRSGGA